MFNTIAAKLGFVRMDAIRKQLNYGHSVAKRLDEHREVVERIQQHTSLLEQGYWHTTHLATQDDYLMRLFHLVHECWPDDGKHGISPGNRTSVHPRVRPRPSVLGPCQLPEWLSQQSHLDNRFHNQRDSHVPVPHLKENPMKFVAFLTGAILGGAGGYAWSLWPVISDGFPLTVTLAVIVGGVAGGAIFAGVCSAYTDQPK